MLDKPFQVTATFQATDPLSEDDNNQVLLIRPTFVDCPKCGHDHWTISVVENDELFLCCAKCYYVFMVFFGTAPIQFPGAEKNN